MKKIGIMDNIYWERYAIAEKLNEEFGYEYSSRIKLEELKKFFKKKFPEFQIITRILEKVGWYKHTSEIFIFKNLKTKKMDYISREDRWDMDGNGTFFITEYNEKVDINITNDGNFVVCYIDGEKVSHKL